MRSSLGRFIVLAAALGSRGPRTMTAQAAPGDPIRMSATAFFQFAQQLKDTAGHGNNFDVGRAYLTATAKLSHGVGGRVTADVYRVPDGPLAYRLKYAYASYTPERSPFTFRFGMTGTPWSDFEELLWGYRVQSPAALDRNGYLFSSDLGFAIDGTWRNEGLNVQAGVFDGEGYSKAPGDFRKDAMTRVSIRLVPTDDPTRFGGLRLSGYAQHGTPTGGGKRDRYIGMLSFHTKRLTMAAEYAAAIDSSTAVPSPRLDARVITTFVTYTLKNSPIGFLARLDSVDPDVDTDGDLLTRAIAGISYRVSPNLLVVADIDHLHYQNGAPTPALEAVRSTAFIHVQLTF